MNDCINREAFISEMEKNTIALRVRGNAACDLAELMLKGGNNAD